MKKNLKKKEEIEIPWEEYGRLINNLVKIVQNSGEKFDMVIGISRGGLVPALALSYGLGDIPMAIMAAKGYGRRKREENIIFSRHLVMTTKNIGERCLLVDDLTDSGRTMRESILFLKRKYSRIKVIKTALIFVKSSSTFQPNFYVKKIGEEWVKFWYEGLIPKEK